MKIIFNTFEKYNKKTSNMRGFTLVEMIVSIALFSIVILVCTTALLSLVAANRKAHALQLVLNNLDVSIDGMVRAIRMGTVYHCASSAPSVVSESSPLQPMDCQSGNSHFAFQPFGQSEGSDQWWMYNVGSDKRIYRKIGNSTEAITIEEITIDSLQFFVIGAEPGSKNSTTPDIVQPRVVIVVKGSVPIPGGQFSRFHIQVTATQRVIDI